MQKNRDRDWSGVGPARPVTGPAPRGVPLDMGIRWEGTVERGTKVLAVEDVAARALQRVVELVRQGTEMLRLGPQLVARTTGALLRRCGLVDITHRTAPFRSGDGLVLRARMPLDGNPMAP